MMEDAIIKLGLKHKEFLDMTLYQYRLYTEQHNYASVKAWEHTRLISYTIYCTVAKDKVDIDKFMPLSTDPKQEETVISPERLNELAEQAALRYKALHNDKKNT